MNYSKDARDFITHNKDKFKSIDEFKDEVNKLITDLDDGSNKHQVSFYKQVLKQLMSREEAIEIMEKQFGTISKMDFNGLVPAWSLGRIHEERGNVIVDDDRVAKDSFTLVEWTFDKKKKRVYEVIFSLPYYKVDKFIKNVKYLRK